MYLLSFLLLVARVGASAASGRYAKDDVADVAFGSSHDQHYHRDLQGADPAICSLSGGTISNITALCELCVSPVNCGCIMDTNSFDITCSDFCLGDYCGEVNCSAGTTGSNCGGELIAVGVVEVTGDDIVDISFQCDVTRTCTCTAKYGVKGEECAECVGAGEGVDCSNVATANGDEGPCVNAGLCVDETVTGSPTPEPVSFPRPYRSDEDFLAKVDEMTLPEASKMAGIPIGAAVPDNAGGREWSLDMQKKYVPSVYNMIVVENGMKWNNLLLDPDLLGLYNYTNADVIVDHAVSVGAQVRGHVLIWGRGRGTTFPEALALEVEAAEDPKAKLDELMQEHIKAVTAHFDGRVDVWDVVNEHLTSRINENIFYTTMGDDYVAHSFNLASEALQDSNQTTRLVWNEALSKFDLDNPTISWWLEKLRAYKNEAIPIDGIGVQGHNINRLHNTTALAIFLKTVADMGYDIELTEIDAPIKLFMDEDDPFEAQGRFFKEYVNACLDSGRCRGVTFWGIDDANTWYDGLFLDTAPNLPLLIDEEGYFKPAWMSVRGALAEHASLNDVGGDGDGDEGVKSSVAWHLRSTLLAALTCVGVLLCTA